MALGVRFGGLYTQSRSLRSFNSLQYIAQSRNFGPTTLPLQTFVWNKPVNSSFPQPWQYRCFAKVVKKEEKEDKKRAAAPKKKKKEKSAKELKKEAKIQAAREKRIALKAKKEEVSIQTETIAPKSTAELFSQTLKDLQKQEKEKEKEKEKPSRFTVDGILRQKKRSLKGWKKRGGKEAVAVGRSIRCSMKKLQLLTDLVRGLTYKEAQIQLKLSDKRAAKEVLRTLDSCRFNAENAKGLVPERLIVSEVWCGRSSYIKRRRYHSKGRAGTVFIPIVNLHMVLKELKEGDVKLMSKAQQREVKYLARLAKLKASLTPNKTEVRAEVKASL